ncbi:hypothetical protein ILUMI_03867 [Ignelater luminosus]|uniref:Lipid/polyisoprenoid-binding YceI-like domain-containing protein n=1 Tax=Ignelater luminosus TaxID=2038154 RepID=A0A8K0DKX0_IGNLU|nr:hypothetical protein ILUMI_03867 [Ignelater luminosus]
MKTHAIFLFSLLIALAAAQQNEYTVQFDTLEIVSYNKDLIENPVVTLFKFNETSQAFNGSGILKKDLGMDIKVNMDAAKVEDDGKLKQMANVKDVDMCDLIERNQFGLKDLLKYGNFTTCPWKAASYVISNAMIDVTKLPPKAPAGKYIMNLQHFSGTTELMQTKFTGSVIPKAQ